MKKLLIMFAAAATMLSGCDKTPEAVRVKSVSLDKSTLTLEIGASATLTATVTLADGATETATEQAAPKAAAPATELRVRDTNADNWQAVIKATRKGIDIPMPDGWKVTKAQELLSDVAVTFEVGGSTTAAQYGQMLFDITKAASQNGNREVIVGERGVEEGAAVNTLAEAVIMAGATTYNWCFTEKSEYHYTRQIHYSFSEDGKKAALSF